MKRDEWVLVKSESELRPGMAVQLRNCVWCGKRETLLLGGEKPSLAGTFSGGPTGEMKQTKKAFRAIGWCTGRAENIGVSPGIREGRLYRLADWNFDETSDDATAPVRELVGAEPLTTVTKARAGK